MITVSDFYKREFGRKVYKISLDAGCTCPNRDGTKATGGCIFCSESGSGDFAASRSLVTKEQLEEAKKLVNKKFSRKKDVEKKYIAYFQNFTSTYGNEESLIKKYQEALDSPDIVGLAVATRPDCISGRILDYLAKASQEKFVQVELGLQTSSKSTARLINRCFPNSDYLDAVRRLHSAGRMHIVTHLIFGLPGEAREQMLESVRFAAGAGTDGIKLTVLYVLEGTRLAELYKNGRYTPLEMEEYLFLVKTALRLLPDNIVIHRITGDPPKRLLLAPDWCANKRTVLNALQRELGPQLL